MTKALTALPRGRCSVCASMVPVRVNGAAREHRGPKTLDPSFVDRSGKCKGSGKPVVS